MRLQLRKQLLDSNLNQIRRTAVTTSRFFQLPDPIYCSREGAHTTNPSSIVHDDKSKRKDSNPKNVPPVTTATLPGFINSDNLIPSSTLSIFFFFSVGDDIVLAGVQSVFRSCTEYRVVLLLRKLETT